MIARNLHPIGEGRLIEPELIVKVGNYVITPLNHFARSFGKARLVTIDSRQAPCAKNVKENSKNKIAQFVGVEFILLMLVLALMLGGNG